MRALILLTWMLAAPGFASDPVERGADLFFGCDFDLNGTNACISGTRFDSFDGNGRRCYDCHRPSDNWGLSEERVATIFSFEPYFQAAVDVPGLDDIADLERAIISTDKGPRNSAGLINIATNCGWTQPGEQPGAVCFLELGHMQDAGTDLRAFIQDAIRQHLTKDVQRREGIDFRFATEAELDDLLAFMFSTQFIVAAENRR